MARGAGHRGLPIIRRISRERLPDSAQASSIEENLSLTKGDSMINIKSLSSKLAALAGALAMNGLVLGGLGYLFVLQSHPNM
jgi:hypothetical protein